MSNFMKSFDFSNINRVIAYNLVCLVRPFKFNFYVVSLLDSLNDPLIFFQLHFLHRKNEKKRKIAKSSCLYYLVQYPSSPFLKHPHPLKKPNNNNKTVTKNTKTAVQLFVHKF